MSTIKELIEQLELYDDAYHNGTSIIPDVQYDLLKEQALDLQPNHPYFMQVGSDVRGGKIKLPYSMGSLDQIYTDAAKFTYSKWKAKYNLTKEDVITSHKLDGISCLVQYKNGELQIAYSRGKGLMGADITRHVRKVSNIPLKIDGTGHLTIRGELIMSEENFNNNWATEFANPRNMVAGLFNRSLSDDAAIADVVFIAYQMVAASDEYITDTQSGDMLRLHELGFTVVNCSVSVGGDLNNDILTEKLAKARIKSPYALDGIVLTIDAKGSQKNLSKSDSLNPEHSVKYKVLDKNAEKDAIVVDVLYEISKWGLWKPRVEILPIQVGGVTVTYATGFNGKFIVDNKIGPGKKIKLVRAGDVIPYITSVAQDDDIEPQYPTDAWDWNDNKVDFIDKNFATNPNVIFKQVLDFFKTLDVDLLKDASMEKVFDKLNLSGKTYETILQTVLNLMEVEWVGIIGSNGSKIFASLERRLNSMTLAIYLGAVNYFGSGFGVRKAKLLLKNVTNEDDVWNLSVKDVIDFEGFDTKTAQNFVNGLAKAKTFADVNQLTFIREVKTDTLSHLNVVFTGFRDKELQDKLEKAGAKVGSSVSKKSTHLITAEPNSTSSKAVKARELGVETLSVDQFKDKFNL